MCSPRKILTWLGYTILLSSMQIKILHEKLLEIIDKFKLWKLRMLVSRKNLQRLIGWLQFISKCVLSSRRFMNRILDTLRSTFKGKVPVNINLLRDINWFIEYTECSNGLVLLHPQLQHEWIMECDSSLTGTSVYSKSHCISELYPKDFSERCFHIIQLEVLNLVATLNAHLTQKATT